jgi:hypothetical protein
MRQGFLIIIIAMGSFTAHGAVTAFLKRNPVSIVIQGQDSDARRLFDSLNQQPIEISALMVEKKVTSPSGQLVIGCRHSQQAQATSCTINIQRDANVEISETKKRVYLVSNVPEDTILLFDVFAKNSAGNVPTYVSEKQDFAISTAPNRFILSYQFVAK